MFKRLFIARPFCTEGALEGKMNKKILPIMMALLSIVSLCACGYKENEDKKLQKRDIVITEDIQRGKEQGDVKEKQPGNQEDDRTDGTEEKKLIYEDKKILNVGDKSLWNVPMSDNQVEVQVKDSKVTKEFLGSELGAFEKERLGWHEIKYSASGKIESDYSYIWVDLSLTSLNSDLDWSPEDFVPIVLEDDNELVDLGDVSPFLCSIDVQGVSQSDEFRRELTVGEVHSERIGICVSDDLLDKRIGLLAGWDGQQNNPPAERPDLFVVSMPD